MLRATAHVKNTKSGVFIVKKKKLESTKLNSSTSFKTNPINLEDVKLNVNEHDRCLRCGRKLKNIDNRLIGYGPICYEKMRQEQLSKKLF